MVVDQAAELLGREMGGEKVEALRASGTFLQDAVMQPYQRDFMH
jgi:hypothetical protein